MFLPIEEDRANQNPSDFPFSGNLLLGYFLLFQNRLIFCHMLFVYPLAPREMVFKLVSSFDPICAHLLIYK